MADADTIRRLWRYKSDLEEGPDEEKLLEILQKLKCLPVTIASLQETEIGKVVNGYKKWEGLIGEKALEVVNAWKAKVQQEMDLSERKKKKAKSPPPEDDEAYIPTHKTNSATMKSDCGYTPTPKKDYTPTPKAPKGQRLGDERREDVKRVDRKRIHHQMSEDEGDESDKNGHTSLDPSLCVKESQKVSCHKSEFDGLTSGSPKQLEENSSHKSTPQSQKSSFNHHSSSSKIHKSASSHHKSSTSSHHSSSSKSHNSSSSSHQKSSSQVDIILSDHNLSSQSHKSSSDHHTSYSSHQKSPSKGHKSSSPDLETSTTPSHVTTHIIKTLSSHSHKALSDHQTSYQSHKSSTNSHKSPIESQKSSSRSHKSAYDGHRLSSDSQKSFPQSHKFVKTSNHNHSNHHHSKAQPSLSEHTVIKGQTSHHEVQMRSSSKERHETSADNLSLHSLSRSISSWDVDSPTSTSSHHSGHFKRSHSSSSRLARENGSHSPRSGDESSASSKSICSDNSQSSYALSKKMKREENFPLGSDDVYSPTLPPPKNLVASLDRPVSYSPTPIKHGHSPQPLTKHAEYSPMYAFSQVKIKQESYSPTPVTNTCHRDDVYSPTHVSKKAKKDNVVYSPTPISKGLNIKKERYSPTSEASTSYIPVRLNGLVENDSPNRHTGSSGCVSNKYRSDENMKLKAVFQIKQEKEEKQTPATHHYDKMKDSERKSSSHKFKSSHGLSHSADYAEQHWTVQSFNRQDDSHLSSDAIHSPKESGKGKDGSSHSSHTSKSKDDSSSGQTSKSKDGSSSGQTSKSKDGSSSSHTSKSKGGSSSSHTNKSKDDSSHSSHTSKSKDDSSSGQTSKSKDGSSSGHTSKSKDGSSSSHTSKSKYDSSHSSHTSKSEDGSSSGHTSKSKDDSSHSSHNSKSKDGSSSGHTSKSKDYSSHSSHTSKSKDYSSSGHTSKSKDGSSSSHTSKTKDGSSNSHTNKSKDDSSHSSHTSKNKDGSSSGHTSKSKYGSCSSHNSKSKDFSSHSSHTSKGKETTLPNSIEKTSSFCRDKESPTQNGSESKAKSKSTDALINNDIEATKHRSQKSSTKQSKNKVKSQVADAQFDLFSDALEIKTEPAFKKSRHSPVTAPVDKDKSDRGEKYSTRPEEMLQRNPTVRSNDDNEVLSDSSIPDDDTVRKSKPGKVYIDESAMSFDDFMSFDEVVIAKKKSKASFKKASSKSSSSHSHTPAASKSHSTSISSKPTVPIPSKSVMLTEKDFSDLLPEPQAQYRPLRGHPYFMEEDEKAKSPPLPSFDPDLVGVKTLARTQVYSGRKHGITEVKSLYDLCMQSLIENIDLMDSVGGVPYSIMKPVLERCSAIQLFRLEDFNPHFLEDSDELWQNLCKKDFRGSRPGELDSWRELYLRKFEEREAKYQKLKESMSSTITKGQAGRKAQLAYVDTVAKPPREVLRKQRQFGTGSVKYLRGGNTAVKAYRPSLRVAAHNPIAEPERISRPVPPMMLKAMQMRKNCRR